MVAGADGAIADRSRLMPWSPQSFKERHNKNLSPAQASVASRIANAMLKRGADEGVAIATANKRAKQKPKSENSFGSLAP